jgi:hypothetical protein
VEHIEGEDAEDDDADLGDAAEGVEE